MAQSNPGPKPVGQAGEWREPVPAGPPQGEFATELVDFVAFARFMRRYRLVLFASACIGAVAAWGISHLFPRIYRAEVLVVPVASEQSTSTLSSLASRLGAISGLAGLDLGSNDKSTSTAVALLQSRRFIEQFITEHNLLPVLFASRWDTATGRWNVGPGQTPPSLADAYERFEKDIMTVTDDKKTGLMLLRIEWLDRRQASEWANALIAELNANTRDLAMRDATDNMEYLNRELRTAETVELRQSIYSLLQMQMNKRMMASTRPEYSFRVIDPAQAPEPRKSVRPHRLTYMLVGAVLGGLIGLWIAARYRRRRAGVPA